MKHHLEYLTILEPREVYICKKCGALFNFRSAKNSKAMEDSEMVFMKPGEVTRLLIDLLNLHKALLAKKLIRVLRGSTR